MKFNLNIKKYVFVGAAILCLSTSSCINDLDQNPIIDKGQSEIINESDCQSFLAKIYSGFGLSGNVGPSGGVQDLQGPDQGSLCFLRGLLSLELYPTDEALWNWKDEGIVELCTNNWNYTLFYAYTFYQRAMLNIRYCKEFLDNYPEDCGIPNIKQFRDEVRALRAMNYYYLIDVYRNPGWVWDDSPTNDKSWKPSQLGAKEIFDKVVTELKDLSENSSLPEKGTMGTYGRMTKPVVNTLWPRCTSMPKYIQVHPCTTRQSLMPIKSFMKGVSDWKRITGICSAARIIFPRCMAMRLFSPFLAMVKMPKLWKQHYGHSGSLRWFA